MQFDKVMFVLMVKDMERAIAFYRDVIGLDLKVNHGGWAELGYDDAVVALHAGGDGEYRSTGLTFRVPDIETACAEVKAGGGSVVQPPVEPPGVGIIRVAVADPKGNGFTITQRTQ